MPFHCLALFALMIVFIPSYRLRDSVSPRQFIIWNVGQGQWTTWVQEQECWHFDVGGEGDASSQVEKLCGEKRNRLFLSHWDWDHIGLLQNLKRTRIKLCLAVAPLGPTSEKKQRLLDEISRCPDLAEENFANKVIHLFAPSPASLERSAGSNHLSHVFWLREVGVLIPGDSTTQEEKIWSSRTPITTQGLVLGHHGSRTSTSDRMLEKLPHLHWAVSSARQSRYGHPHREIVERLSKRKIPLLRTEDWGTLHFLFD